MNSYENQANEFLAATNTTITKRFLRKGKYFDDDKLSRDIYSMTISRDGHGKFSFNFGNSIINSNSKRKAPSNYAILSCLTKYDVGSFEDFCSEFDYDDDSRKAYKIYKSVVNEWENVNRLFSDVMEQLQEIN